MTTIKKKTSRKLLGKLGFAELVVALSPILGQYPNFIGLIVLVITAMYLFVKKGSVYWYMPLLLYLGYVLLHEICVGIALPNVPSYFINRTIVISLSIFLVFFIAPNLDYEKFYNSLLLVAIICFIGLLYHYYIVFFTSNAVSVIKLPLLPELRRSEELLNRPCSFFAEPASYASFMIMVVSFCIIRKDMVLAALFSISILLSTSTNGFAFVAIVWLVFLLISERGKRRNSIIWAILFFGVFYWLLLKGFLDAGFDKINQTNFDDDVRLTSGLYLYRNIPLEYKIFGIDVANVYDFIMQNPELLKGGFTILVKEGEVYLTSFWENAIHFGLPGVALYLYCLLWFVREKKLWPYLAVCLVALFSQSGDISMKMIFMIVIYRFFSKNKLTEIKSNENINSSPTYNQ